MIRHCAITLLLTLFASLCATLPAGAAKPAVRLRYPAGVTAPDLATGANTRALNLLARDLRAIAAEGGTPALEITAFTSPDAINRIAPGVAEGRAAALAALMAERGIMAPDAYTLRYDGPGWGELTAMIEADSAAPRRTELLTILRTPDAVAAANSPDYAALLRSRLRKIDGGFAWSHMVSHLFPIVRNTLLVTVGADTARMFYRIGYNDADMAYASNGVRLRPVLAAMRANPGARVKIDAFLEPVGDNLINRYIARERFVRLAAFIAAQTGVDANSITFTTDGNGWAELTHCLQSSPFAWRHEAMAVIAGTGLPADRLAAIAGEQRVRAIRSLDSGRVWHTLCTDYFPALRGLLIVRAAERRAMPATAAAMPADTLEEGRWSLGTNLLYDAALAPTLELGLRLSQHWALRLEGSVAWWKNSGDGRTYQLALISPEVRFMPGSSTPRRGHAIGAFGAVGIFDLSGRRTGHRGEAYMGGFTYTYARPLSRSLSLEATLGAGYMWATYRDYTPTDGHHVYRRTRRSSYVGPLKARLALVWHIDTRLKPAHR